MDNKSLTFDSKIKELQEKKSNLDKSILEFQKQENQERIDEILCGPVVGWEEKEALNKAREYRAKKKEIESKIKEIPEDADKTIKEIDEKIAECEARRARVMWLEPYRETEEWIFKILWEDKIYQYAVGVNDVELIEKLKTRRLTEAEYQEALEKYPAYMESFYSELFPENKKTELDNQENDGSEWGDLSWKGSEWEGVNNGINEESASQSDSNDETPKKRKVTIERSRNSLNRLNVDYDIIDKVILPTKWKGPRINRSGSIAKRSKDVETEYENKIGILFDKVLTQEHWFKPEDYKVIAWQEPKRMVRQTTYVVVSIPSQEKMIILNNGYWEAAFLCDILFDLKTLTTLSKDELLKDKEFWNHIRKLKFENEEDWVNKILQWLGKDLSAQSQEKPELITEQKDGIIKIDIEGKNKSDEKEGKETIEKRKAQPSELFFSFEKYLKFFLGIDDLKGVSETQIQSVIDLLKKPNEYEGFCNVCKKEYLNDTECVFPGSLSDFINEICPVDITERQFIMILQSNHMEKEEFERMFNATVNKGSITRWESFGFKPFWSKDFFNSRNIDSKLKDEIMGLYVRKKDMKNWLRYNNIDPGWKVGRANFKHVNTDILNLEMRIIDTTYPHLKKFYMMIYGLYSVFMR